MKKTILASLALSLTLSFTSCAGESAKQLPTDTTEPPQNAVTVESQPIGAGESAEQLPTDATEPPQNTVTVESQSIGLEGVSNARQLGGYYTADGRRVKQDVLLRTGALSGATEEDIAKLQDEFNLTTIIDFRTSAEIASAPDPEIEGVDNIQIRVIDESSEDSSGTDAMTKIYAEFDNPAEAMLEMVRMGALSEDMYTSAFASEAGLSGYREFIDQLLAHEDGAILYHCSGGKDRAGTASVILLTLLGVDEETVLNDFALTNDFNSKKIAYMTAAVKELTDNQEEIDGVAALVGVSRANMEKLIDLGKEESGSLYNYFVEKLNITDEEVASLQKLYLE